MNDKLGSYITKLMTTIVDKEQEEFVKNLALSELTSIKQSLEEFIVKKTIKKEDFDTDNANKQLLQEKKNGKQNK